LAFERHKVRPLEIIATLGTVAFVSIFISSRFEKPLLVAIAAFAILLLGLQSAFEGIRWQMLPVYFVGIVLFSYVAISFVRGDNATVLSGLEYPAGLAALLVLGVGIFLSTLLPVFELPAPTGPFKIGTQVRHIVVPDRRDPIVLEDARSRELMAQIWYPADVAAKGVFSRYRERKETSFWNARYSLVKTHALLQAPISRERASYPVVVFAPSWWGGRNEATFQAEELASHGYVVVGMDHPFSSRLTVFPDGRVVHTRLLTGEDYSSATAFNAFIAAADEQVSLRAEDARSVLDFLGHINAGDPEHLLTGRLDMDRVGILGYSIGGGAAAQACWLDHRFKAGVDLDGMLAADSEKQGTRAPFLFVFGGVPPSPDQAARADGAAKRKAEFELRQSEQVTQSLLASGGVLMILPDQNHASFSDAPFYSPINSMSYHRAVSAERVARIVSRYVIAFFDLQFGRASDDGLSHSPIEIGNSTIKTYKPY
jgi:dienelactone hydrolase